MAEPNQGPQLVRQLNLFDSTMIMAGIVIGSGIFVTTGIMARYIPSAGLILLAWAVGGLITLAGALTYAELGAALPKAGGQYVYLREAYGPIFGFLFGWQLFFVYMSGGIAALAVVFAEYCGYLIPELSPAQTLLTMPDWAGSFSLNAGQMVAVAVILFLSGLNYTGLYLGKTVQNTFTVAKIAALVGIILLGLGSLLTRGDPVSLRLVPDEPASGSLVVGFGIALVAVFWAFDGWNNVNFVAGEIKQPGRTLPRALIIGTVLITALYLLVNLVYVLAVPMEEMIGVVRIAERAATALFGNVAAVAISVLVVISTFGALNGSILAGPRVYYAMARDRLFFARMAEVHPRFHTPGFAILIQAIWSVLLALTGTFEQILTFTMFTSMAFWIAATAAVFTLRRKRPDLERPYRAWGYPVVPILFIIASAGILLNTLIEKPVEALAGVGFTLLGVPVYLLWQRRGGSDEG
jgi:APA family basic amino acid/polyamine antiporter